MKKKYLINSFFFQYDLFQKELNNLFTFTFTPEFPETRRALSYIPANYLAMRKLCKSKAIDTYDIIHLNRMEALLAYKKRSHQKLIFEIHGFDVGVLGKLYLKDLHTPWKKVLGLLVDFFLAPLVKRKIKSVDLFYVSTPDLVEPIYDWCGRKPLWLPNPVQTDQFSPEGAVEELRGNPACFLAARLHGDKRPEIAFELFQSVLREHPEAVLHLIDTGELKEKYHTLFEKNPNYEWHPYMDKETLASVIRGSDLVFGDFSIGALSLLPMQIMLCKKPIVTLDRYEIIKQDLDTLKEYTTKLVGDEKFRNETIERNYAYVLQTHAPKKVAELHVKNLERA